MHSTRILIIALSLIVGLGIGWYVSDRFGDPSLMGTSGNEASPQETPDPNVLTLAPVTHMTGEIQSVEGDRISIRIVSIGDATLDPTFFERNVQIGSDTQITIVVTDDEETAKAKMDAFQKEMDAFAKAQEKGATGTPPMLPVTSEKRKGSKEDLKVGDLISVVTAEDVRLLKEFTARAIEVLPPRTSTPSVGR